MRTITFSAVVAAAALTVLPSRAVASDPGTATSISGDYVEARTAEVFAGGCIMGSEGEPSGREAILAWRVNQGRMNGVALDGLSVVAIVTADRNLGTQELGGAAPHEIRTVLRVDARATPAQRAALTALARALAPSVTGNIVETRAVPVAFVRDAAHVAVKAGEATLNVSKHMHHDPSCGAIQWFDPLATTSDAQLGLTNLDAWSGDALGTKWELSDRKSSFFGTFALDGSH